MQKLPGITSGTLPRRPSILCLCVCLTLAGCGNSPVSSAAGYFQEGILGGKDLAMSRQDVFKIPYASIAVRLARGPQAFVVLAKTTPQTQEWIAADKHLIDTQNGRITKTIGFDTDLTQTSFIKPDPLLNHLDPSQTYQTTRLIDVTDHMGPGDDTPTDSLIVTSTIACQGPRTITILGTEINTFLWTERTTAQDQKWVQTNKFWQDQHDKTIWKSQQNIAPNQPTIEIITLRKYFGE